MVEQYLFTSWIILSWLLLALQVKVGKVASFVGHIFVVKASTTKTTNILPYKSYQLYSSIYQTGFLAGRGKRLIEGGLGVPLRKIC